MSDSPKPIVTSVSTRDDCAIFLFEDGHRVIFEGYKHGWGYQIEGLRRFRLFEGEEQVVQYDSRLRRVGPSDGEHQFVQVSEGYDRELIVSYWEAARTYINLEYLERPSEEGREGDPDLWFPWRIASEGWNDLRAIKEGQKELPVTSST